MLAPRNNMPEVKKEPYRKQSSSSVINKEWFPGQLFVRRETQRIHRFRALLLTVLVLAAVFAAVAVFRIVSGNEEHEFETAFQSYSTDIIQAFGANIQKQLSALDGFSSLFTTEGARGGGDGNTTVWPYVTLPDFHLRARDLLSQFNAISILAYPIVTEAQRDEWEQYAQDNFHSWFNESLEFQEREGFISTFHMDDTTTTGSSNTGSSRRWLEEEVERPSYETGIADHIFGPSPAGGREVVRNGGPYTPLWQNIPLLPGRHVENNNVWSFFPYTLGTELTWKGLASYGQTINSDASDPFLRYEFELVAQLLDTWGLFDGEYGNDPVGYMFYPIFEDQEHSENVVGSLLMFLHWRRMLSNILSPTAVGIVVVYENDCDQMFTFLVNGGTTTYLGEGDMHDSKYDFMEESARITQLFNENTREFYFGVPLSQENCQYNLRVYPSAALEEEYVTRTPVAYTVVVLAIFVFTSAVFYVYDLFVERRQKLVMDSARRQADRERQLNEFMAHEIRNPLSSAISALSFIKTGIQDNMKDGQKIGIDSSGDGTNDVLMKDIQVADSSLQFINELLRNMLDVHRVESDEVKLELGPADVAKDVLEPVASILFMRGAKVSINVECPPNLFVATDRMRLKQIVLNLASNATKFVREGYIRLSAHVVNDMVELRVEDSGPGIPPEKRNQFLFAKFQESLDSLNQGTGIGLSVCKTLSQLLDADIWLDEDFDSGIPNCPGTSFVINLNRPALKTDLFLDTASTENTVMMYSDMELQHLPESISVLFVDDDTVLRRMFVRSMKRLVPNWDIQEACNGETALRLVETQKYDIIFMDMYMASFEKQLLGTEAVRELRSKGVTSIICGLSANDMEEQFLREGANAFSLKPFPCEKETLKSELLRILSIDP